ncbi:MAG: glutamate ABC transporter substrate-binding protein [Acidimicrobiales bacterium]
MRARRWAFPAIAVVLMLVAAACGDGDDDPIVTPTQTVPTFAAGSTMANLQAAGKIRVGVKFDQPGFGLKNPLNNQIEGFDVEIAKLIAQAIFGPNIDGKVEFSETVSRVREEVIEQGTVDMVVATYTINDARKMRVGFAGPYYVAGQDIMVREGNTTIRSVTDLNGKKACSAPGSTSIQNLQRLAPQADTSIVFDTYSLCADALGDNRVEAVTTDNAILIGLINANPGKFRLVGNPFTTEPYGIGVKRADTQFRSFVNDRLEAIVRNGSWATAYSATLGKFVPTVPAPPNVDRYAAP